MKSRGATRKTIIDMNKALLFDYDGVVANTEIYYTKYWSDAVLKWRGMENGGEIVKGRTLKWIMTEFFAEVGEAAAEEIVSGVYALEDIMPYDYIPGLVEFVEEARRRGFKTAIVTSSNTDKMGKVYAKHPEIHTLFDAVLTSENFVASKPDPDCFLKGMERFDADSAHTVVFEDSVNGLRAGNASGAITIGLVTSNPLETVRKYSDLQVPDFTDMDAIFRFIDEEMERRRALTDKQ